VTELVEVTNFFVWRLSNFFLYLWLTLDFFKVMSKQNFNKQKGFSTFTPPHLLTICGQTNVTVKRLKTVFAVLTMLFIMTLSSLTTLKAQPPGCPWTIVNRLDCKYTMTIAKICGGAPLVVASAAISAAGWSFPNTTTVYINDADLCAAWPNCNLPAGCTLKISIDGGVTYHGNGETICCPTVVNRCTTNGCVDIVFDCINHTITLFKPVGCP
jgi:hypothetical protein